MKPPSIFLVLILVVSAGGCSEAPPPREIQAMDSPAGPGSMAPHLSRDGSAVFLSWLEPTGDEPSEHTLRFSRLEDSGGRLRWGPPVDVARGGDFFVNWADVPSIHESANGDLLAHWLQKSGAGTYAYDVQLARSTDGGRSWSRLGPAHDDGIEAEHGFVSMVREDEALRLFWLDGREAANGAMTLRTSRVGESTESGRMLDDRVCDCCPTSATVTASGPLVVYRDRSSEEVRDIYYTRITNGGWSSPAAVHADGWEVPGCPVNGPSVGTGPEGRRVAVAWFTAADNQPVVKIAFSEDAGESFQEPMIVDRADPVGRVGLVVTGEGTAIISWLASRGEEAADLLLARATMEGEISEPVLVARSSRSRASGVARLVLADDSLVVAWTEAGEPTAIRTSLVPLGAIPAATRRSRSRDAVSSAARPYDGRPGSRAPSYEAMTLEGEAVSLEDLEGSPVLLNFWATWCGPCREETPDLVGLHETYLPAGLQVVGVTVDTPEAMSRVRQFIESEGIGYMILSDPEDRASGAFDLPFLPATFLFDSGGVLVWRRFGIIDQEDGELTQALASLFPDFKES